MLSYVANRLGLRWSLAHLRGVNTREKYVLVTDFDKGFCGPAGGVLFRCLNRDFFLFPMERFRFRNFAFAYSMRLYDF